jgi:two-component system phosphate regulon sensor histidine kinase PhoR
MRNFAFRAIPGLVILLLLAVIVLVRFQGESFESAYTGIFRHNLDRQARLIRLALEPAIVEDDMSRAAQQAVKLAKTAGVRISILSDRGKVLIDTERDPAAMGNELERPEVAGALRDGSGLYRRYSETAAQELFFAAHRIADKHGVNHVLRVGMPMHSLDKALSAIRRDLALLGITLGLLMLAAMIFWNRRTRAPIERIAEQSRLATDIDIDFHFSTGKAPRFIRILVRQLNLMVTALKNQIARLTTEKRKRDVIFSSMSEGVIAVGLNGVIIDINLEALRILDSPSLTEGCSLRSLLRGSELHDFVMRVLEEGKPLTGDFTLDAASDNPRHLRIRGALMKSDNDETAGVVLVLSDLTRLYQLENFRRDFIADVSHEIKTPLTVISGAVEALQNGADQDPEEGNRFRTMILQQSERLNNLVRDILSISALEHRARGDASDFVPVNLGSVVRNAIEMATPRATAQRIELLADLPDEITVEGDPQLLEQAIFNLIDNAVKYSGGSKIEVKVRLDEKSVILRVTDNGCGISREHLSRIFERFYRVDKTRSRKLGGTGLGLAIVKHTVQYHQGTVSVESSPGNGCTFTVRLPLIGSNPGVQNDLPS